MPSPKWVINFAAVGACVLVPLTASAQDDRSVAGSVQQCRTIADTAARVACYDGIQVGQPAAAVPAPAAEPPRTFGSNQLPPARVAPAPQPPRMADARPALPDRIETGVAAVAEREPGVLLLTLQDDSQWLTVDTVTQSYNRPRRGATVEIVGASMDSYLLRYGTQRSIRVRRVR